MAEGTASGGLLESIVQLPVEFAKIAAQSPEQAALLASGSIIIGVAVAYFGYLLAGATLEGFVSLFPASEGPPQRGR
ncbi:hypothetical protein [Natronomonas sp. EA1]|uniref:hypothetical protein n=1 Tax=Natronomonas sp. EA1 TaxID=3421655 RepID=UPI003EB9E3EA